MKLRLEHLTSYRTLMVALTATMTKVIDLRLQPQFQSSNRLQVVPRDTRGRRSSRKIAENDIK